VAGGHAGCGRRRRENAGHADLTPAGAGGGGCRRAGTVRPYGLLPACRSGRERRRRAEYNKAPFMYEMKGALSGRAAPDPPVAWLPRHRAPPAGAKHPPEPPVSRLFPCPGVTPGWCPFPTVKLFLLPSRWPRKSLRESILSFSLSTHCPQNADGYPPAYAQAIHKFIHRSPDVTRRILGMAVSES